MTIQSQIDDILRGIEELKKSEGSKFQIKAMERTRKSLQKQLDKLEKANQDDTLTFEQLGIDRLFVDEAHEFKNLFVATKLQNVAGISNSASQKHLICSSNAVISMKRLAAKAWFLPLERLSVTALQSFTP